MKLNLALLATTVVGASAFTKNLQFLAPAELTRALAKHPTSRKNVQSLVNKGVEHLTVLNSGRKFQTLQDEMQEVSEECSDAQTAALTALGGMEGKTPDMDGGEAITDAQLDTLCESSDFQNFLDLWADTEDACTKEELGDMAMMGNMFSMFCMQVDGIYCLPIMSQMGEEEIDYSGVEPHECGDGSEVPANWLCDGYDDCDNGTDETHELCPTEAEKEAATARSCEHRECIAAFTAMSGDIIGIPPEFMTIMLDMQCLRGSEGEYCSNIDDDQMCTSTCQRDQINTMLALIENNREMFCSETEDTPDTATDDSGDSVSNNNETGEDDICERSLRGEDTCDEWVLTVGCDAVWGDNCAQDHDEGNDITVRDACPGQCGEDNICERALRGDDTCDKWVHIVGCDAVWGDYCDQDHPEGNDITVRHACPEQCDAEPDAPDYDNEDYYDYDTYGEGDMEDGLSGVFDMFCDSDFSDLTKAMLAIQCKTNEDGDFCRDVLDDDEGGDAEEGEFFECTDGSQQIPEHYKCDGSVDCMDESDEVDCVCPPDEAACDVTECPTACAVEMQQMIDAGGCCMNEYKSLLEQFVDFSDMMDNADCMLDLLDLCGVIFSSDVCGDNPNWPGGADAGAGGLDGVDSIEGSGDEDFSGIGGHTKVSSVAVVATGFFAVFAFLA